MNPDDTSANNGAHEKDRVSVAHSMYATVVLEATIHLPVDEAAHFKLFELVEAITKGVVAQLNLPKEYGKCYIIASLPVFSKWCTLWI